MINYKDNEKSYIIAPQGLKQGDIIEAGKDVEIKLGNSLELKDIPPGTSIHNVELIPGNGGKLARSAGSLLCSLWWRLRIEAFSAEVQEALGCNYRGN